MRIASPIVVAPSPAKRKIRQINTDNTPINKLPEILKDVLEKGTLERSCLQEVMYWTFSISFLAVSYISTEFYFEYGAGGINDLPFQQFKSFHEAVAPRSSQLVNAILNQYFWSSVLIPEVISSYNKNKFLQRYDINSDDLKDCGITTAAVVWAFVSALPFAVLGKETYHKITNGIVYTVLHYLGSRAILRYLPQIKNSTGVLPNCAELCREIPQYCCEPTKSRAESDYSILPNGDGSTINPEKRLKEYKEKLKELAENPEKIVGDDFDVEWYLSSSGALHTSRFSTTESNPFQRHDSKTTSSGLWQKGQTRKTLVLMVQIFGLFVEAWSLLGYFVNCKDKISSVTGLSPGNGWSWLMGGLIFVPLTGLVVIESSTTFENFFASFEGIVKKVINCKLSLCLRKDESKASMHSFSIESDKDETQQHQSFCPGILSGAQFVITLAAVVFVGESACTSLALNRDKGITLFPIFAFLGVLAFNVVGTKGMIDAGFDKARQYLFFTPKQRMFARRAQQALSMLQSHEQNFLAAPAA